MNEQRRTVRTAMLGLLAFSVVGASLLAGTNALTRPNIEKSERDAKLRLVAQVLPAGGYDNDPVASARPLPADPLLGLKKPGEYYQATLAGKPVAVILEAVAPDGYGGEIDMLVGIMPDGSISGVRITHDKETPGLGDYIEIAKSEWIHIFDGKSLDAPKADAWRVKKDGGAFDYKAGATITPRAVIKAVKHALEYFTQHRTELLNDGTEPSPQETKNGQ